MSKNTHYSFDEPLIFERSREGRIGFSIPEADVQTANLQSVFGDEVRDDVEGFPEVTEPDVVRHFTRLSQWNFSIDSNFYPLGSCTMKYNPRINERTSREPGFLGGHPLLPDERMQGSLALMHSLAGMLAEIAGMDQASLQPAAGAQGEMTGLMMIRKYHEEQGDPRKLVLVPDSAHGTNPATTAICGYKVVKIPTDSRGNMDLSAVREKMSADVAGTMITNPNTLGLFEEHIADIAEIVHGKGGLVYGDGANLNALLGQARPGDLGIDVIHINLHKTFTTPHGGGGPGAGPVAFKKILEPYMPSPVVVRRSGAYALDYNRPRSIGRVRTFLGNFGMFTRAYTYIREMGADGLKRVAELAVLNANYVKAKLTGTYNLPYERTPMHEVVFNDKHLKPAGVKTMDVAKRLIDFGFHPPTIYFPLVVDGALMIEPTETENRETLDAFIAALEQISKEAESDPQLLRDAPHDTFHRRLDEVHAAKHPVLVWKPQDSDGKND